MWLSWIVYLCGHWCTWCHKFDCLPLLSFISTRWRWSDFSSSLGYCLQHFLAIPEYKNKLLKISPFSECLFRVFSLFFYTSGFHQLWEVTGDHVYAMSDRSTARFSSKHYSSSHFIWHPNTVCCLIQRIFLCQAPFLVPRFTEEVLPQMKNSLQRFFPFYGNFVCSSQPSELRSNLLVVQWLSERWAKRC